MPMGAAAAISDSDAGLSEGTARVRVTMRVTFGRGVHDRFPRPGPSRAGIEATNSRSVPKSTELSAEFDEDCRTKLPTQLSGFFFWKALRLLLIRITQNGRRPTPNGVHRNWTYRGLSTVVCRGWVLCPTPGSVCLPFSSCLPDHLETTLPAALGQGEPVSVSGDQFCACPVCENR